MLLNTSDFNHVQVLFICNILHIYDEEKDICDVVVWSILSIFGSKFNAGTIDNIKFLTSKYKLKLGAKIAVRSCSVLVNRIFNQFQFDRWKLSEMNIFLH